MINKKDERQKTNDSLFAERLRTDAGYAPKTDSETEKEERRDHFRSVENDRGVTDKSLFDERAQSDLATKASSTELAAEQSAHTETKVEMTSREEFLAIVSHDLRNPIGAISSSTEMFLTDPAFADMNKDIRHWVEFIKRNSGSAMRLVNDILDMERIAERKLSLLLDKHNLSDLVREVLENYSRIAATKSISLNSTSDKSPVVLSFDRDRIGQVLGNLVGNSLKFTQSVGTVTVSVKEFEKEVQVCVADDGPGIPEEKQKTIFNRYAQINNRDRQGLGLGLYISKTLTELHHGKIWLDSNPGQGTRFYISLPK